MAKKIYTSEQGYKTFFRLIPHDDVQAPADAIFMAKDLGAKSVYIIDDQSRRWVSLRSPASLSPRKTWN